MNLLFKNKTTAGGLLLCLMVLFSFSFISAETQLNLNTNNGLWVDYPNFEDVRLNTAFNLTTEVYNISDGVRITNANCTLRIYDQQGDLGINQNLTLTGGQYNLFLTAGNFTKIGTYSFNIYCANTLYGGFASDIFNVSPEGKTDLAFYLIIFGISLVFIILGFGVSAAPLVVIGSFGLFFVGLYSFLFGIDGISNLTYSRGISILILAASAYVSIRASMEALRD